ncbi:MAG: hypothetical protein GWN62_05750 [Aliifodinibius sp.]|nr:hypothetical protein [Fodinibius sp.]
MQYMWHRLAKLFEGFELRVVFYARRQDESIDSRIIQEIKGRGRKYDINYVRFLYEKSSLNYHYFYTLLEDVFGKGRVDVRLYDRKNLVDSDVRNDFLDYLGLTNDSISVPHEEDNVAPSYKLIAMYRIINSLPLSNDEYTAINEGLWKEFGASGESKAVVLGKEERNEVMGYFKEYNTMFIRDCVSPNAKKAFEDVYFGPCKQVMPNIYIDGVDVVRYFQSKGFELCKAG